MPEATWLHGYDGELEIRQTPDGRRYYHDLHYNAHVKLDSIRHQLKRMETPIVEFHAMLVAMEAYKALGKYNENIVNMYEYGDFLLRVQAHGKKIMLEPNSLVTYVPPRGVPSEDREFFELRWCEAWTELTYRSMAEQHGLTLDHPEWKLPHNLSAPKGCLARTGLRKPRRWLGRNQIALVGKNAACSDRCLDQSHQISSAPIRTDQARRIRTGDLNPCQTESPACSSLTRISSMTVGTIM
jgi:hypothetical protein